MIDYLELHQQETDALWEAVQRLEEPLIKTKEEHLDLGTEGAERMEAFERGTPLADQLERQNRIGKNLEGPLLATEKGTEGLWRPPLSAAGDSGQRLDQGYESGTGENKLLQSQLEDPFLDNGQAEQLDRIFRRDSRRYDGGFFLY